MPFLGLCCSACEQQHCRGKGAELCTLPAWWLIPFPHAPRGVPPPLPAGATSPSSPARPPTLRQTDCQKPLLAVCTLGAIPRCGSNPIPHFRRARTDPAVLTHLCRPRLACGAVGSVHIQLPRFTPRVNLHGRHPPLRNLLGHLDSSRTGLRRRLGCNHVASAPIHGRCGNLGRPASSAKTASWQQSPGDCVSRVMRPHTSGRRTINKSAAIPGMLRLEM